MPDEQIPRDRLLEFVLFLDLITLISPRYFTVFTRRHFGAGTLSVKAVLFCFSGIILAGLARTFFPPLSALPASILPGAARLYPDLEQTGRMFNTMTSYGMPVEFFLLALAFLGAAIYHRIEAARVRRQGHRRHNRAIGISRFGEEALAWQPRPYFLHEPGLIFALGALFTYAAFTGAVNVHFGPFLMTGAVLLLLENAALYRGSRAGVRDQLDQELDAESFHQMREEMLSPRKRGRAGQEEPAEFDPIHPK